MEMESLAEVKRLDRDCRAHKRQRCKLSRAGTPQLLRISGCSSQQVGAYMGSGSQMQFRQAGSLPSGYALPSLPLCEQLWGSAWSFTKGHTVPLRHGGLFSLQ